VGQDRKKVGYEGGIAEEGEGRGRNREKKVEKLRRRKR
jgi:hypothetical protein